MRELNSSSRFILQVIRNEFDVSQLDFDDLDWSELFTLATKHRIFPRLYKAIKEFIPETFKERYLIQDYEDFRRLREVMVEKNRLGYQEIEDMIKYHSYFGS